MFYKQMSLNEACEYVLHDLNKGIKGDIGLIAIDKNANICFDLNCPRMHRGWTSSDDKTIHVKIYKED